MKKTSPKRPALTLAAIARAVAGCSAPLWASAEQLGWSPQRSVEFVVPMPNPKLRRGQTAICAEGQARLFSDIGGTTTLAFCRNSSIHHKPTVREVGQNPNSPKCGQGARHSVSVWR
jgi:hypothetical protein